MRGWIKVLLAILVGLVVGSLLVTPAGAHFQQSIAHIWAHIRPLADARYLEHNDPTVLKRDPAAYCTVLGEPQESYAPCADTGTSQRTLDGDANAIGVSIAIGDDGNPVISYHDETTDTLKVAKCNDRYCEGKGETISTVADNGLDNGAFSSIAIGADGNPAISYYDATNTALRFVKCNDRACLGNNETARFLDDDPNTNVGTHTSIAMISARPVISYHDETNGALKVIHCGDASCGSGNQLRAVDNPASDVGEETSIAVGADGKPVVSYQDQTAGTLKFVKCDDVACQGSGEQITTLDDPATFAGHGTSVTIGTDELPIVSHAQFGTPRLRIVHCDDPACAGTEVSSAISPGGGASRTSIQIAHDGRPVIAHNDAFTPDAIRVTSCNDQACAAEDETTARIAQLGADVQMVIGTDGKAIVAYVASTELRIIRVAV